MLEAAAIHTGFQESSHLGLGAAQSFFLTQHYLTFAAILELNAVLIPHPHADQAMTIISMLMNAKTKRRRMLL